jgi:2-dehydropantoate 2-reductase
MGQIAVLGPGGVGGFIAAALARAGQDVVVVAREPTAELINRDGIEVRSAVLGDFRARPTATPRLERSVEVLIVATKATALDSALARIEAEPGQVVPLLNGIEHLDRLRRRFERVAAGVIRIDSDRPEPGRVVQKSPSARVDLAGDDPAVGRLAQRLQGAGIEVRTGQSEAQLMWSKLMRLNALACTTSAADRTLGPIRDDPEWRTVLEACVEETAAVARAEGAALDARDTLDELERAHADLGSSMQRDLAAGREPELDAIAGAVIRAGARHGLACPTVTRLRDLIAARYSGGLMRGAGSPPGA